MFYFNSKTQRYHYSSNNVMVGEAKLRSLIDETIVANQKKATNLVERLARKNITLSTWEMETAKLIKTSTIQAYKIGKPELTQSDYGKIGNQLRFQYAKLRQFSRSIQAGELSQAQAEARVKMYFSKIREAHQEATRLSHLDAGFNWERRHLSPVQNCSPCVTYASMGWQKIGTLPRIGNKCDCIANCKCYFSYSLRSDRPKESYQYVLQDSCLFPRILAIQTSQNRL